MCDDIEHVNFVENLVQTPTQQVIFLLIWRLTFMCKDDLWNVNDSTMCVDDLLLFEKCWCCFASSCEGLIGCNHTSYVRTSTRMRRDTARWRRSPRDGERRSSSAAVRFADEVLTLVRKVQVESQHVDSAVATIGNAQNL